MKKGKTIKQLADEIGVTKQAVQKRISREPLYTDLQPYVYTQNKTKYIIEYGESLIKQAFNFDTIDKPTTLSIDKNKNVHSDVYTILQKTIDTLQGQLEQKDKQIESLQEQLKIKDRQIENANMSLQASQTLQAKNIQLLTTLSDDKEQLNEIKKKKKSFFIKFRK